ncbi:protein-L-isoaspartate(D-aspartate) O-methyltransferase [Elusimicrobiota bacterium]
MIRSFRNQFIEYVRYSLYHRSKIRNSILLLLLHTFLLLAVCGKSLCNTDEQEAGFTKQRHAMVKDQIVSRGINNRYVIDAIKKVKRHQFIGRKYRDYAYTDQPLPIENGQTISQPYIVALMSSLIRPQERKNVLEIGTGSGYQAAILAEICDEVYTIEIIEDLANSAKEKLKMLGYDNITVKHGNGFAGWEEHAPYDAIIVTAAPEYIPQKLLKQLDEGGSMVIPVGPNWTWQTLFLIEKKDGQIIRKEVAPVTFVPMTGDDIGSGR